ncbi:hypothetical protein B0T16DRAFT_499507, partial [Cercophora newfieldiana]
SFPIPVAAGQPDYPLDVAWDSLNILPQLLHVQFLPLLLPICLQSRPRSRHLSLPERPLHPTPRRLDCVQIRRVWRPFKHFKSHRLPELTVPLGGVRAGVILYRNMRSPAKFGLKPMYELEVQRLQNLLTVPPLLERVCSLVFAEYLHFGFVPPRFRVRLILRMPVSSSQAIRSSVSWAALYRSICALYFFFIAAVSFGQQ